MKLNILTNSRPTANLGAELIVGCVEGNIKVTPDFAKKLRAVTGEYIAIGEDADGKIFAFKGNEDGVGNKLAKSGNYLQMSSKNVWVQLEGDLENNRHFKIVDEVEVEDEEAGTSATYLEVAFDRAETKSERIPSGDKQEDAGSNEVAEEAADADDSDWAEEEEEI